MTRVESVRARTCAICTGKGEDGPYGGVDGNDRPPTLPTASSPLSFSLALPALEVDLPTLKTLFQREVLKPGEARGGALICSDEEVEVDAVRGEGL